jgi:hypothetical protein
MHKSAEQEQQLKLAIRDIVARNPLVSTHQLRRDLYDRGFKTAADNPLDWYYVAKVLRKLNREKALAVDQQKIQDRLAITKEQYRIITDRLWKIVDWKLDYITEGIGMPQVQDIIRAANTIVKLDLAVLKAEMDAGIFDRKLGSVDVNVYRAAPLDPEVADRIAESFKRWGIDLTLPVQRPKLTTRVNGPTPAADHPHDATPAADPGASVQGSA